MHSGRYFADYQQEKCLYNQRNDSESFKVKAENAPHKFSKYDTKPISTAVKIVKDLRSKIRSTDFLPRSQRSRQGRNRRAFNQRKKHQKNTNQFPDVKQNIQETIKATQKWNNVTSTSKIGSTRKVDVIVISSDSDCEIITPSNVTQHHSKQGCDNNHSTSNSNCPRVEKRIIKVEHKSATNSYKPSPSSTGQDISFKEENVGSSTQKAQGTKRRLEDLNEFKEDLDNKRQRYEPEPLDYRRFSPYEIKTMFERDSFSQQIRKFLVDNEQQSWYLNKKLELAKALENAVNYAVIPGANIFLVGSSVNGFGRFTSDADMCIVINPRLPTVASRTAMNVLYKMKTLLQATTFATNLHIIDAKVSILKFSDSNTRMECDLNVNNLTGLRNTHLMFAYAQSDPRVRPLVLCVKEWAHKNNINDASQGTLSSYALVLMVIHFLQCAVSPPVVPNLQKLYPRLFSPDLPIHQIEVCAKQTPTVRSKNTQSLSELLLGFFDYFAKYDFSKIMSIRLGNCHKYDGRKGMWLKKRMRIEEPFDQTNVARAVQPGKAPVIFEKFKAASRILEITDDLHYLLPSVAKRVHMCN